MVSTTYDLIKQAITEKKQIHATYQGYRREMCPHAIGHKEGKARALFWQFDGSSSKKPFRPNWKCMDIYIMRDVQIVEGDWHTSPYPLKNTLTHLHKCVGRLDVEVSDQ